MVNMGELFRFPRIPNVDMARVTLPTAHLTKFVLAERDLLFARRSLTLEGAGKCSIVQKLDEPTTWESSIIRARVSGTDDARFYFYYFASPSGRRAIEGIVQQVAAAGIRLSELGKLRVPRPPREQQVAIAEVLGTLDDKVAANDRLCANAERLAQLVFDSFTTGSPRVAMNAVLQPILGGTPERANLGSWLGKNSWASARDITEASFGVLLNTTEHISDSAARSDRFRPLPSGSVLLTARGTVGAVARLAVPSSFNQSCYGFVPGSLPPGVLYFSIRSATAEAKAYAHGSVFSTITLRTFDHLQIPNLDPTLKARLERQLAPLLETIVGYQRETGRLAVLRDTLLPALMSGRLRVRDAQEQVGEVL